MNLTELLQHHRFEEIPTKRLTEALPIKRGHEAVDQLRWHKFINPKTGMGVYAHLYDNSEGMGGFELLFPADIKQTYWETMAKIGETAGITFEEAREGQLREENMDHWSHNYPYLQEIRKIYDSLRERLRFLARRKLEQAGLSVDHAFMDAKIGYIGSTSGGTFGDEKPIKAGENLCMVLVHPPHKSFGNDVAEVSSAIDALQDLAEATREDWQNIETATIAYTRHLRDLYRPILPGSPMAQ